MDHQTHILVHEIGEMKPTLSTPTICALSDDRIGERHLARPFDKFENGCARSCDLARLVSGYGCREQAQDMQVSVFSPRHRCLDREQEESSEAMCEPLVKMELMSCLKRNAKRLAPIAVDRKAQG